MLGILPLSLPLGATLLLLLEALLHFHQEPLGPDLRMHKHLQEVPSHLVMRLDLDDVADDVDPLLLVLPDEKLHADVFVLPLALADGFDHRRRLIRLLVVEEDLDYAG